MSLDIFAYLSLLLVLCIGLVKAADLIEEALVHFARKLGISTFVIGFIVLSVASSLPEISLAFTSASNQLESISVGNLLGGVIILLTLAISINVIRHKEIPFRGRFGLPEIYMAIAILSLPLLVILDSEIALLEGIFMLGSYAAFATYIAYKGHKSHPVKADDQKLIISVGAARRMALKSLLGVVALLIISRLIVDVAVHTATLLHMSNALVGLLVLALGTNLPELTIAMRSQGAEAEKLAIGNLLGSATINTAIMGTLAILAPVQLSNLTSLVPSMIIMSATLLLFGIAASTGQKITRYEGLVLLGMYFALIVAQGVVIILLPQ